MRHAVDGTNQVARAYSPLSWEIDWTNSAGQNSFSAGGTDLHLEPDRARACAPVSRTRCGRRCARDGWRPGTRLPSSRSLAADLGVARNTVADSYAELVAEGWLTAQQGSGTRVASGPSRARRRAAAPHDADARRPRTG